MDKLTKKTLLIGYISHFLNIGIGILILPLVLINFDTEGISLWFSFITLASLVQMLELGLLPTVTRHVAYILSGTNYIKYNDVPLAKDKSVDFIYLKKYLIESEIIYRYLSLILVFFAGFGGWFYLNLNYNMETYQIMSWLALILSYIINIYTNYISGYLFGANLHKLNYISILIQKLIILTLGYFLTIKFGLLGLCVSFLVGVLLSKIFIYKATSKKIINYVDVYNSLKKDRNSINFNTVRSSFDLGLVQVSTFMSQRFSILLLVGYVSKELHAAYSLSLTLLYTLYSFSTFFSNAKLSTLSHLITVKDRQGLKKEVATIFLINIGFYLIGATFLIYWASYFLEFLSIEQRLLNESLLIFLCIIIFLELIHGTASIVLTAFNSIPFRNASIATACCILITQIAVVKEYGILGILTALFLCQLSFNNWYWPYSCYRRIKNHAQV